MTELYYCQQQSNCQTEKKIPKNNVPVFVSNSNIPQQHAVMLSHDEKGNIVRLKNTSESRAKKWIKQKKATPIKLPNGRYGIELKNKPLGNIRVPVLNPDGTPAMPTKSSRARKWIKDGKAIGKRTKSGKFYVQLIEEPSGRKKQDVALTLDPGSRFSGVAVCSKKAVLDACNLELTADEKKNRFALIKYRMDKRRELRRSRRHRNCRRRKCRFLNRTKTGKMAPSIRSRKQLELKQIKEEMRLYPISVIGIEDVAFNHYTKKWGKNFSHVEIGKKWLFEELKKIVPDVRLIKGYETNIRREQLGLKKSSNKEERNPESHVTDCIAMGSIILGLGIETKTPLREGINFDIITRPKYSRRKLHNEQPNKDDKRRIDKEGFEKTNGHRIRKRFGGTTIDWTNIRKGDYVEVRHRKKDETRKHGYIPIIYRGWVGGFENDKHLISLYNFDWKVVGQFDNRDVRLLNRNNGLMTKSLWMEEIGHNIVSEGMKQSTIDGSNIDIEMIRMNMKKVKDRRERSIDIGKTIQRDIDDAWS